MQVHRILDNILSVANITLSADKKIKIENKIEQPRPIMNLFIPNDYG